MIFAKYLSTAKKNTLKHLYEHTLREMGLTYRVISEDVDTSKQNIQQALIAHHLTFATPLGPSCSFVTNGRLRTSKFFWSSIRCFIALVLSHGQIGEKTLCFPLSTAPPMCFRRWPRFTLRIFGCFSKWRVKCILKFFFMLKFL